MIFIEAAAVVLLSIRALSCAKFNWGKKKYFQAAGMVLIVMMMYVVSAYVLFRG